MARLPIISKYWTLCRLSAFASSKVYAMPTPSIGFWATPLTLLGSGRPAASRTVGATSMTWWNCERTSPFAWMRFGQRTTMPLRVPPKLEATCLAQVNGVSPAMAQPAAMCGNDMGPPSSS